MAGEDQWPPTSLLAEAKRVFVGEDNLDKTLDQFISHARTDQQQYFVQRLKEYEAMLHLVGLLAGVVGTDQEQSAAQEKVKAAIEQYLSTIDISSECENPFAVPIGTNPRASQGMAIAYLIYDFFGWNDGKELITDAGCANDRSNQAVMQMISDLMRSIWNSLVKWYNDFWALYKTDGLLIAMNRLRIDVAFFAAECAIDVAISAALAGGGVAVAAALKGLRFTGMRVGRNVTRVVIRAIPDGVSNPHATRLIDIDINDADIDPDIDKLLDEDHFGGASPINDINTRAEPNTDTPATTRIQGEGVERPPPPTSNKVLTQAEREILRDATPTDAIRDMVNEGVPNASRANPQPDEWLPGLERTARYEADHIVPASKIMDMDGFPDLSPADQRDILNWPTNFHGMSKSANSSRGNKTFEEWTEHISRGVPVNPELRARMMAEEARLTGIVQEMIYDKIRQASPRDIVPFRSD